MDASTEIERLERDRDSQGNTESPANPSEIKKKQYPQAVFWCFTYNNYEVELIERIERLLKHVCDWYVFQEEIGEQGTPHLQGTLKLKKRARLTEMKRVLGKDVRWSVTKSCSASVAYCSKEDTRAGQIFTYGIELPEEVHVHEPRGWQLQVMDIIKEKPDERTIYWFWEPVGNVGKSALCKYLVVKHNAIMVSGKGTDVAHGIAKAKHKKIILIDVPRTVIDYVPYGTIENIKNGLVFSGKYDSEQLVFNSPHVICFANSEPKIAAMSLDRWKIIKL